LFDGATSFQQDVSTWGNGWDETRFDGDEHWVDELDDSGGEDEDGGMALALGDNEEEWYLEYDLEYDYELADDDNPATFPL
jgi:hypothetical protein